MSQKAIEKKALQVEALTERMQNAKSFVIVDYLGLNVEQVTELRSTLYKNGCEMQVIKNNILRRAAKAAGFEEMVEHLVGPSAIAFSNEDAVAAAKHMHEFAKKFKKLELKVGVVENEFMNNAKIQKVATIPTREELLTMFAGGLLQPIKNVAIALSLHIENLETNG